MLSKSQLGLTINLAESGCDQLKISGTYSVFVNCVSQYAIWHQFPAAIRFFLKELDSGLMFASINNELSISPSGNDIYELYAKKDCNKVVTENFSVDLNDVYFVNPPKSPIKDIELFCRYYNDESNSLIIRDKVIFLKSF